MVMAYAHHGLVGEAVETFEKMKLAAYSLAKPVLFQLYLLLVILVLLNEDVFSSNR